MASSSPGKERLGIADTSDYEPAEYQVEVYPCGDGSYPDDISEVWIAVQKRRSV